MPERGNYEKENTLPYQTARPEIALESTETAELLLQIRTDSRARRHRSKQGQERKLK